MRRRIVLGVAFTAVLWVSTGNASADPTRLAPSAGIVVCNTTATAVTINVTFDGSLGYRQVVLPGGCSHVTLPMNLKSPVTVNGSDAAGHAFRPRTLQINGQVQSMRFVRGPCTNDPADICLLPSSSRGSTGTAGTS